MKKTFTLFATLILAFVTINQTIAQEVYIPDANFRSYLQSNYPSCMDGDNLVTTASGLSTATSIIVANQSISDLTGIEYFTALTYLNCSGNQLTTIPGLASTIQNFDCGNNVITSLPTLPSAMTRFTCSNNELVNLPTLPAGLQYLYCSKINATSLPALPANLIYIDCRDNQLTSVPTLPNTLCDLIADGNNITCIPNYPTGCTLSSDVGTTICTATAISNPLSDAGLQAYPNPFAQTIQVKLSDAYAGSNTVSVYDMSGRVCEQKSNVSNTSTLELGSALQTGIYVIEVTGDQVTRTQVIKQ